MLNLKRKASSAHREWAARKPFATDRESRLATAMGAVAPSPASACPTCLGVLPLLCLSCPALPSLPCPALALAYCWNGFGWLGRLKRRGVGKKEGRSLRQTGCRSSSPQYDALDTTLPQDKIAYALFHGKPQTLSPKSNVRTLQSDSWRISGARAQGGSAPMRRSWSGWEARKTQNGFGFRVYSLEFRV